jgi:hypothetical protein
MQRLRPILRALWRRFERECVGMCSMNVVCEGVGIGAAKVVVKMVVATGKRKERSDEDAMLSSVLGIGTIKQNCASSNVHG